MVTADTPDGQVPGRTGRMITVDTPACRDVTMPIARSRTDARRVGT